MQTKKKVSSILMMAALGLVSLKAEAQKLNMPAPSPLATVNQHFGLGEVTIEYSRPGVKDRTIFGDVVPYEKVWRTGANSTTKITFTDDVQLEGHAVKAGTYGLYTIPNKDSWEIMLYSDLNLAGNVAAYTKDNEVLRFSVKRVQLPLKIETFTMNLGKVTPTSATLELMWENTFIGIKITTDIDDKVMKNIEESMKSDKPAYFRAATYYFENNKDLKKALTWIDKAVAENPEAFYMMLVKAKIEYKSGDKKAGEASAQKTIELSKKAQNNDYVILAKKLMEENN
jgi:hypothetical protein